jgi:hypothetical protein
VLPWGSSGGIAIIPTKKDARQRLYDRSICSNEEERNFGEFYFLLEVMKKEVGKV